MKMVFIQSEKCHNDGVSRPPIRDNDLKDAVFGISDHSAHYADQIPFIITRQYRVQAYNISFVVLWQYWEVQQAAICQTFARLVLSVDRSWGVGKKWKSEIIIYDTRFRKSIKKYDSKVLFFFWYSFDKCLKNAFNSPKKSFVQ